MTLGQLEALGAVSSSGSTCSSSRQDRSVERPESSLHSSDASDSQRSSISSIEDVLDLVDTLALNPAINVTTTMETNTSPVIHDGASDDNTSSFSTITTISSLPSPVSQLSSTDNVRSSKIQNRSPTPPPSSQGPQKITFIPTATGLVPANIPSDTLSPSKVQQQALAHQTSKENFAHLVRTHLKSPNPDLFRLNDLVTFDAPSPRPLPILQNPHVPPDKTSRRLPQKSRTGSLDKSGSMHLLESMLGRADRKKERKNSQSSTISGGSGASADVSGI